MRKKSLNRAVIDTLESRRLLSVSLVKDINTDTVAAQNAYGNQEITESGGNIYFRADDGVHGPELWVLPDTTGTPAAPTMVKDLDPGTFTSQSPSPYNVGYDVGPTRLTDVNGTLYFSEQYGTNSFGLWKTNGTAAGTVLVYDANAGHESSGPDNLTNVNGTLYFTAYDSTNTQDLYKTDGTTTGTVLVAQFNNGGGQYNYTPSGVFTAVGNHLVFGMYNAGLGNYAYQTWTSDGTTAGTGPLQAGGSTIYSLLSTPAIQLNGNTYIGTTGGLYQTDGTSANTTQIYSGEIEAMVNDNGTLYFIGHGSANSLDLFQSNGTAAGTTSNVTIIPPSTANTSVANNLVTMNGLLLFEGGAGTYTQLWRSDGTQSGTYTLSNVAYPVTEHPNQLVVSGNTAYFIEHGGNTNNDELWSTQGTAGDPAVVKVIASGLGGLRNEANAGGITTQDLFVGSSGRIYFSADDGFHGLELWTTDGTATGTSLINDINTTTLGSSPQDLVNYGGLTYFAASDGTGFDGLFVTDGTSANTHLLGSDGTGVGNLTVANGLLYFTTENGLYETDGSSITPVAPFDNSSALPGGLTNCNGALYFVAKQNNQPGIWTIPTAGASPVELVTTSSFTGYISPYFAVTGSTVFFVFAQTSSNITLYTTQGTVATTSAVTTLSTLNGLLAFGNDVYFDSYDPTFGNTLWRSDGTAQGTGIFAAQKVALPGNNSDMAVAGGKLYFVVDDSTGYHLWTTNGSTGSTAAVPGTYWSVFGLVPLGNKILFSASVSDSGAYAPWISDGTSTGTIQLSSAYVGGWNPDYTVDGTTAYFAASPTPTGIQSVQLWQTDGTASGTMQAALINPSGNADPSNFAVTPNGSLLFAATTPAIGTELWSYTQPAMVPGSVTGTVTTDGINGVAGVGVYLDINGSTGPAAFTTTTTANGSYAFSNVPAGSYIVRETLPTGYTQVSPANNAGLPATIVSGNTVSGDNFIINPPVVLGTISGSVTSAGAGVSAETVFLDANNNGSLDSGELTATTSSTGAYNFSNVPLGSYVIRQLLPAGYTQTTPANSSGIAIAIASGSAFTGENFIDSPPVTIKQLTGTTIGTSGSYKNDGNTIAKATDGNLSTYFDGPNANGNWVGLDLGSAGGVVTTIKFASRSGWASRMNGGIFQASNSASFSSGVVNLYTIASNANPPSSVLTSVNISNKTSYRYYRYLSPNNSNGDVSEVQFFGTSGSGGGGGGGGGGVVHTKLTGTTIGTTGSYNNDGNTIAKATDGSLSTYFDGANSNGNWVGLDLGSTKSISQIAFAPRSGYASRMVGGVIQISTTANFSSGVTTIYTIKAAPASGLTTITLASAVTARYVRYLSPNNSNGDISEFQLFT